MSTAFVVGGSSGIGLEAARMLATAGWTVHVAGRNESRIHALRSSDPGLVGHVADGGDRAAISEIAGAIAPIDALVLTIASAAGQGPIADLEIGSLRRGFDEKVVAMVIALQASLHSLSETGSITFTGAISAHAAVPGSAGIGAANAAVEALVRPLAVELAPHRVNAVSPGLVDTPWWDAMTAEAKDGFFSAARSALPVRHVSTPREIAEGIVFLATNTSTTGVVLPIDGGARFASW